MRADHICNLLDATYKRTLGELFHDTDPAQCQVVIDDYGIGASLSPFLDAIEVRDAEVLAQYHADDHHIAVRVASVIAMRERAKPLEALMRRPRDQVDGLSVPSGKATTPKAKAWLDAWEASGKPWPSFIKKSVRDARASA